ncbi:MAG: nucleotide pyrophosphohydrolase [Infirmifilum sp.]|uniref:Nucleotide pyrophosphohydrolase n=1 Tax=Infirmifilum uzonense TaxID=1550241 RepID=A0A0F7FH84_9CREN|nr:nucleotide pyrophosphohydrolase [Infirmifilum uzonense]AKG38504.1 nucleotide pyrophosphohydrolase [Infirmifilum uzonense]
MCSLKNLEAQIVRFRDEREWKIYHTPKNLAISLIIELGELLEHFQWKTDEEILSAVRDEAKRKEIAYEIADVAIYLILLSHELGVDLEKAIVEKLQVNGEKYPVEKVKGELFKEFSRV